MGIKDKLANAKKSNWLTEGLKKSEIRTTIQLSKISGQLERIRLNKNMTQKEFAEYMGVSQGMISKWESREYNFTIETLNEICEKLEMEVVINIQPEMKKPSYKMLSWSEGRIRHDKKSWMNPYKGERGIA